MKSLLSVTLLLALAFFQAASGQLEEDAGLCFLQSKARALVANERSTDVARGCDLSEVYEVEEPPDDAVHARLGHLAQGSSNPWHSSGCKRSKRILDDLQALMSVQAEACKGWERVPRRVLSFGCSVGIEGEEAKARFPESHVFGYDIDAKIVAQAKKRTRPGLNISFMSNAGELPLQGFDLVLVNNVLYNHMSPVAFQTLLKQLLGFLNPAGGILELEIYDNALQPACHGGWCEGMRFNSSVAWEGIRELLPSALSWSPERTCTSATYPSTHGSTLFVYRSGGNL